MIRRGTFRVSQILAFVVVSFVAGMGMYYFPNLPPALRNLLPKGFKGSVRMVETGTSNSRFLEWFNRDPERKIPSDSNVIVSPADGIVWGLTEDGKRKHVIIEMRYTDVHVQRVPIEGEVISIEGEGKKLEAGAIIRHYDLEKMLPFQKVTSLKSEIGIVKVRQITSFFAQRIEVYLKIGQRVKRGERLGRVLAGSTIVLEVPERVSICVNENQDVIAGETVIGTY